MSKIESFTSDSFSDAHTVAIYGPSGAGKTTLAASFPRPILFFDFDGKMGTIPADKREGIFMINYSMKSPTHGAEIFEDFKQDWKKIKQGTFTLPNGEKPKTIVLDSVTLMDIMSLLFFIKEDGKDPETTKATLPVYGNQANFYNSFFAGINSLKSNVVFIFHESFRHDPDGQVDGIQPLITGKGMLNKIPAIFQETWYLRVDPVKGTRYLNYKPYKQAVANSIWLKGKGEIINPTYELLLKEAGSK
jgi:hypothetical protein